MTFDRRKPLLLLVLAVMVAGAALAAGGEGFTFHGPAGGFDAGGGSLAGGGRGGLGAAGIAAAGYASSAAHGHHTGYLALFGQPLLLAGADSLDFGGWETGDSTTQDVEVVNAGGVTLLLSSLEPAGGAASPFRVELPAAPVQIQPGASQTVRVRYGPSAAVVERDTLLAVTNDPFTGTWRLPLSGFGTEEGEPVMVVEADTLRFDAVPVDSSAELSFTVRNAGGEELLVGPIAVSGSAFAVFPDSFAADPSEERTVTVTFAPPEVGAFRESLSVPSNESNGGAARVVLEGATPGDLRLLWPPGGSVLFTAVLQGGAPPSRVLLGRNAGGDTLRWKAEVSDATPWLEATPANGRTAPGDTVRVTVTADPEGMPTGLFSGSVVLQNRDRPIDDLISVSASFTIQPFTVEVSHDPETAAAGAEVTVTAEAGVLADSARIHWRRGGEAFYATAPMNRQIGGEFTAPIPGTACDIRGLEYWVAVHGSAGEVRVPDTDLEQPARIDVWLENISTPTFEAGRHRMIAVPLATSLASAPETFGAGLGEVDPAVWRLGRWETAGAAYREHPEDLGAPVDAGYGFWVITAEERKIALDGFASYPFPEDSCFSILLEGGSDDGWNQIGHPFAFPVATAGCFVRGWDDTLRTMAEAAQAGLVENAFYDWRYDTDGNGHYLEADLLEPWRGYFVNNLSGGALELLVPARESVPSAKRAAPLLVDGAWTARFRAYAAGGASQEVVLGAVPGARPGRDAWDRSSPPRPDRSGPDLFAGDGRRVDRRAPTAGTERWTLRVARLGEGEVLLRASLPGPPPEGRSLFLADPVAGAVLPVEEGTTYRFLPRPGEEERLLEAVCGPSEALAAEGLVAREPEALFRLDAPRPNPFVRGTSLRYSLPERGTVSIRIYNLSGRLVRSLAEGTEEAGEHLVDWDGRDERGRPAAPGIYFVRLTQDGGRVATARMVLFR